MRSASTGKARKLLASRYRGWLSTTTDWQRKAKILSLQSPNSPGQWRELPGQVKWGFFAYWRGYLP
jgi:hypothetical protein